MTINTFFIIYKGARGIGLDKISLGTGFGIAFGIGGISALITIPLVPRLKMVVENNFLKNNNNFNGVELSVIEDKVKTNQLEYNIKGKNELKRVISLHNDAEKFDEKTEEVFKYLQIFTAVCDAFSHGANDVANAVGPFAAIWTIYRSGGVLDKKASMGDDAYWILGLGGIGIATGLFVYGKKITYAIGEKLVKITPSRGVAIELSSALVIITGSRLKIPLSTTHCQVGATVGVGLLEDTKKCKGVNCKVFYKTVVGWIITCVIVGLTTVLFISPGVYGPSVYNASCYYNISI
jgi:solute carrier family 20 (sodium-dependent phosphate transporter)